ncbi:MOB kinase activator-like 4 [Chionoecetes opilio]|uniref:MOB kinase activator-like 4 n=1 Tax=Chionoecetes opilio TaxID=41210 RepID=A0A8J4YX19_CHIOP|nr:MOB kinase activator-like 4 [Chionoecetes opilio]
MDSTLVVQQYIQQTIRVDHNNIDTILNAPETQDEGVWKYEHLRQFCMELNGLAVRLQGECQPSTCTQMTATEQWIFLCAAHKTPKECPAIDYTRHTLDGAACLLNSNKYFPSRVSIKESSVAKLGSVCRRVYRIFSHAYFHHRQIFDEFECIVHQCFLFSVHHFFGLYARMLVKSRQVGISDSCNLTGGIVKNCFQVPGQCRSVQTYQHKQVQDGINIILPDLTSPSIPKKNSSQPFEMDSPRPMTSRFPLRIVSPVSLLFSCWFTPLKVKVNMGAYAVLRVASVLVSVALALEPVVVDNQLPRDTELRGRRRRPAFELSMWNTLERIKQDLPRTTNSRREWHREFEQRMAITHPTVCRLVSKLRKEQSDCELTMDYNSELTCHLVAVWEPLVSSRTSGLGPDTPRPDVLELRRGSQTATRWQSESRRGTLHSERFTLNTELFTQTFAHNSTLHDARLVQTCIMQSGIMSKGLREEFSFRNICDSCRAI